MLVATKDGDTYYANNLEKRWETANSVGFVSFLTNTCMFKNAINVWNSGFRAMVVLQLNTGKNNNTQEGSKWNILQHAGLVGTWPPIQ